MFQFLLPLSLSLSMKKGKRERESVRWRKGRREKERGRDKIGKVNLPPNAFYPCRCQTNSSHQCHQKLLATKTSFLKVLPLTFQPLKSHFHLSDCTSSFFKLFFAAILNSGNSSSQRTEVQCCWIKKDFGGYQLRRLGLCDS